MSIRHATLRIEKRKRVPKNYSVRGISSPALLGLLVLLSGTFAVPSSSPPATTALRITADQAIPAVTSPAERARALALPAPTAERRRASDVCAAALDKPDLADACFPTEANARAFIHATRDTGGQSDVEAVQLTGSGGTELSPYNTSSGVEIAMSCMHTQNSCLSDQYLFYAASASYYNCTHTWPQNDYYRNSVTKYNYFVLHDSLVGGTLNCNKVWHYVASGQATGSGYENSSGYPWYYYTSQTMHSFSVHNN